MRLVRAGLYCQCVLGLKPQAQSYSPFGTKSSTQPKYLSTFSEAHHPHSAWRDSRTTTRTRTKPAGEGGTVFWISPALKPRTESFNPFGIAHRRFRFEVFSLRSLCLPSPASLLARQVFEAILFSAHAIPIFSRARASLIATAKSLRTCAQS